MTTLREAAQQVLEAVQGLFDAEAHEGGPRSGHINTPATRDYWVRLAQARKALHESVSNLRDALAQEEQATGKEPLQVDPKGGMQIATPLPLTTTDLAWLETRRLVRVWKELGQMRWTGADEGWDRAIEAVRARLDKECQDVLAWKEKVEASGETAAQLLQKLRGMKDE